MATSPSWATVTGSTTGPRSPPRTTIRGERRRAVEEADSDRMSADPPLPRSALGALPAYKPGKSAEVAMAEHDLGAAVKLASNENPYDPLPSVRSVLAEATSAVNRYPDHRAEAVRSRVAD